MIVEKITKIYDIITEIEAEDPAVARVLRDGFGVALNTLDQIVQNGGSIEELDVSDQLKMVTDILGFDVEQLVILSLENFNEVQENLQKEADEETLAFITADEEVDDYERFIQENKIKENLDFLKNEV